MDVRGVVIPPLSPPPCPPMASPPSISHGTEREGGADWERRKGVVEKEGREVLRKCAYRTKGRHRWNPA